MGKYDEAGTTLISVLKDEDIRLTYLEGALEGVIMRLENTGAEFDARLQKLEEAESNVKEINPYWQAGYDEGYSAGWDARKVLAEAELARRLAEPAKPTQRQKVAEAFLHAALKSVATDAEMPYQQIADMIRIGIDGDSILANDMAAALEAAQDTADDTVEGNYGELPDKPGYITDGYQYWSEVCSMCGEKSMSVVRPGKVQCGNCG